MQYSIIDLDEMICLGQRNFIQDFKVGSQRYNFGGLMFLMERLSLDASKNNCTAVFCINPYLPNAEKEIIACREPETRMQYQICYDKLGTFGTTIYACNSRKELDEKMFNMIKGIELSPLSRLRVYTRNPEFLLPVAKPTNSFSIFASSWLTQDKVEYGGSMSVSLQTFDVCITDYVIPFNCSVIYLMFKDVVQSQARLQKLINLYNAFANKIADAKKLDKITTYKIMSSPEIIATFLDSFANVFTTEEANSAHAYLEKYTELFKSPIIPEPTKQYNPDGANNFLKMCQLYPIIEYLDLDPNIQITQSNRNYIRGLSEALQSGVLSEQNGIEMPESLPGGSSSSPNMDSHKIRVFGDKGTLQHQITGTQKANKEELTDYNSFLSGDSSERTTSFDNIPGVSTVPAGDTSGANESSFSFDADDLFD